MFDHIRRSALPTVDADKLKTQAAEVGAALSDASVHAGHTAAHLAEQAAVAAVQAKEWAAPRVEAAVEWATPRVEKALRDAAKAAEPTVERAAEKAVPMVDSAHDAFVEEVLPKLTAAITAAVAAAVVGADKVRDAASARLTEIAHLEVPEPRRSHTGAKVFWLVTGAAAAVAALFAWKRSKPTVDPWAEQPWEPADSADRFKHRAAEAREELGGVVADVKHELGDAAEAVGEVAGEAVAMTRGATDRAREAAERAAEKTREATDKAREAVGEVAEKTVEATRKATPRKRSAAPIDAVAEAAEATHAEKITTDVPEKE